MDKVNIQDLCEEHYDDILPIIMDKVRRDKRKEAHARLDFRESFEKGRRAKEGSQNSSAGVSPVRYHTSSRRPRVQDRLRYNDGNVFNRLRRRRRSVHERLSDTYSPSTTRSRPSRTSSRDPSRIRGRSPSRSRFGESYDGIYSKGTRIQVHEDPLRQTSIQDGCEVVEDGVVANRCVVGVCVGVRGECELSRFVFGYGDELSVGNVGVTVKLGGSGGCRDEGTRGRGLV
ncbi:hypothetical protein Tco_1265470 [Tanacetum coccineum]